MTVTSSVLIGLVVAAIINFITNLAFTVIQIGLAIQVFLPTDVFYGIFDVVNEPLYNFMPYVNWFIPLDFAVFLIGTYVDVYATYIIYKYFKKVIASLFGNTSNPLGMITDLLIK